MGDSLIVEGMPFKDYLAYPAESRSALAVLGMRTPADYLACTTKDYNPSKAMFLGSLVDCLVLELQDFDQRYKVLALPINLDCPFCGVFSGNMCVTKEGRTSKTFHPERKTFCPAGIEAIDRDLFEKASAMASAVLDHPEAGPIVRRSRKQVSLFWTDEETGLNLKARPDLVDGNDLWDLKTCADGRADARIWPKHAVKYGYHYQSGMYVDGFASCWNLEQGVSRWGWICVESTYPYKVAVFRAAQEWIDEGRKAYKRALRLLSWCRESGEWGGYTEEIQTCEFPRWAAEGSDEWQIEEEDSDE